MDRPIPLDFLRRAWRGTQSVLTAALVGLPLSGRSTVFNLLTGLGIETSGYVTGRTDLHRGVVHVPDPRLDFLSELYHPRKLTAAQIEVTEVPGLVRGASEGAGVGNRFLTEIRQVDALVHVLRAFGDPDVPHPEGSIDPVRDLETVELELLLADLSVLENRMERLRTGKRRQEHEREEALVKRCIDGLSDGQSVRTLTLTDEEAQLLSGFGLLTDKPGIWVLNADEGGLGTDHAWVTALSERAKTTNTPLVALSAKIEAEILQLAPDEREGFLADLGVTQSGIDRLAGATYRALGLISFLTAGEDEVRAWPIRDGSTAQEAAAKIHSDISRGFIRAEVVAFEDLRTYGNMLKAREAGHVRLEGKEYRMQDGDVVNYRFHV